MQWLSMVKVNFDVNQPVIVLDVAIKGKVIENAKMALDTGATYIMIPWKIAKVLGLEPEVAKERIDMTTASGVEKVPLMNLESVSVLGKTAHNVKAIIHDLPQRSYVDGLLELSFLRNFNLHLNFGEGYLELE